MPRASASPTGCASSSSGTASSESSTNCPPRGRTWHNGGCVTSPEVVMAATSARRRAVRIVGALVVIVLLLVVAFSLTRERTTPYVSVAIVTGGQTRYWDMVLRGAEDAARRHRVRLTTVTPASDEAA